MSQLIVDDPWADVVVVGPTGNLRGREDRAPQEGS